jgi:hypothetical protein
VGDNVKLSDVSDFLGNAWYEKSGLFATLLFVTLAVLGALHGAPAGNIIAALVFLYFIICAAWWWSRRPPKTPKNKIGFLVSIACSDDKESQKLHEDFVQPLRNLIKSGKTGHAFHFMVLPQFLAREVVDHEQALSMRLRTRSHFVLYGRVRLRRLGGQEHHVINLEGIVAHKPVSDDVQKQLAVEFAELLPRNLTVAAENDLLTFQVTSEWADVVARYVIGLAAAVSGDLSYAEELFNDAYQRIQVKNHNFPVYHKLTERIPVRISELYQVRILAIAQEWAETRAPNNWEQIEAQLKRLHPVHRTGNPMIFAEAILQFVKYRNVEGALTLLKNASDAENAIWHLNVAFLRAYNDDLKRAAQHYRKAAFFEVDANTVSQVESFMVWVLEQEPQKKAQLHYCLGIFNWRIKGDKIQAKKDLANFLRLSTPTAFGKERQLAEKWIKQL